MIEDSPSLSSSQDLDFVQIKAFKIDEGREKYLVTWVNENQETVDKWEPLHKLQDHMQEVIQVKQRAMQNSEQRKEIENADRSVPVIEVFQEESFEG